MQAGYNNNNVRTMIGHRWLWEPPGPVPIIFT